MRGYNASNLIINFAWYTLQKNFSWFGFILKCNVTFGMTESYYCKQYFGSKELV